jgi:tetratricopeptide (TPR) repeat protein
MIGAAQQHITTLEKRVGPDARSPLFAQLAHYYLEASRAQEALRLCDAGLANFPFYTTGHLIKGKVLVALNMKAEARREFEFVLDFLPNNEEIKKLIAQIPPSVDETLTLKPKEAPHRTIIPEPPPLPPSPPIIEYKQPVSTFPEMPSSPESTFNFGITEQAAPVQQPESAPYTSPPQNFFEELTQASPAAPTEEPYGFGAGAPPVEEQDTFKTSPFSEFNFPQPEPFITSTEPTASTDMSGGFDFTPPASEDNITLSSTVQEEESFEHYASKRSKELSGQNTTSMEDYLSNKIAPTPQEFTLPATDALPPVVQDKIEELTTKLQSAGKITPVINFAQKETPTTSEQDTPAGMGFVTPTLAEIYAKQGWFDDAIKAYKTLARNKPAEKEKYEKRIAELEELKKKAGG